MHNKATIIGRLGNDPEIRYTANQKAVANISVATTENWKDSQTGERKERTEWHRVVLFGKLAEIARDHLKKGALVLFEGSMRTRKWQDKDGKDHFTTEINAEEMKMLSKPSPSSSSTSPTMQSNPSDYPPDSYDDLDDIAF